MKRIALLALYGRGTKLWVVALLMVAAVAVAMATPDHADATPIYSGCSPSTDLGWYRWYIDEYGNFTDSIEVNDCELQRLGAGPMDRERVIAHELGHAQGLPHSDDPNDIMYHQMLEVWGV